MTGQILEPGLVGRLFDLDGRVAAVVGGGSGLGAAMAVGLAQAGAAIAVVDIADEGAERTCAEIAGAGGSASAVHCDVTASGDVEGAVAAVLATHGRVDVLINSAGIAFRCPAEDFPEERLDAVPRGQPQGDVPDRPGLRARDARGGIRQHRQHRVDRRLRGLPARIGVPGRPRAASSS